MDAELSDQILNGINSDINSKSIDSEFNDSNELNLSHEYEDLDEQYDSDTNETEFKETFEANMDYFGGKEFFNAIFGDEPQTHSFVMGGDSDSESLYSIDSTKSIDSVLDELLEVEDSQNEYDTNEDMCLLCKDGSLEYDNEFIRGGCPNCGGKIPGGREKKISTQPDHNFKNSEKIIEEIFSYKSDDDKLNEIIGCGCCNKCHTKKNSKMGGKKCSCCPKCNDEKLESEITSESESEDLNGEFKDSNKRDDLEDFSDMDDDQNMLVFYNNRKLSFGGISDEGFESDISTVYSDISDKSPDSLNKQTEQTEQSNPRLLKIIDDNMPFISKDILDTHI